MRTPNISRADDMDSTKRLVSWHKCNLKKDVVVVIPRSVTISRKCVPRTKNISPFFHLISVYASFLSFLTFMGNNNNLSQCDPIYKKVGERFHISLGMTLPFIKIWALSHHHHKLWVDSLIQNLIFANSLITSEIQKKGWKRGKKVPVSRENVLNYFHLKKISYRIYWGMCVNIKYYAICTKD